MDPDDHYDHYDQHEDVDSKGKTNCWRFAKAYENECECGEEGLGGSADSVRNGWAGYDYWSDDESFDDDCSEDEKSRYCSPQKSAGGLGEWCCDEGGFDALVPEAALGLRSLAGELDTAGGSERADDSDVYWSP